MDPRAVSTLGLIIVSAVTLVTFTGALVVSFFFQDKGLLNLTVGAAIANATTAVAFWLGSPSGSQKKDDVEPCVSGVTAITVGFERLC
jgi:hypothetical protein